MVFWQKFLLLAVFVFSLPLQADQKLIDQAKTLFGVIQSEAYSPDSLKGQEIELGRKLFFDFRLSKDGSTACVRCHWPMYYGADKLDRSMGYKNNLGARNAQTILNLKYHKIVHWKNDRVSLEDQAIRAFTASLSLGNENEAEALMRLKTAGYENDFKQIYKQGTKSLSLQNAAKALAEYQRSLVTPAPFDRFLEGDIGALTKKQREGLKNFINLGCFGCHNGPSVGGQQLQRFGFGINYWEVTGSTSRDPGRYDVTKDELDRNVFKVPSLRNIAQTAPYFHDASARDLKTAIRWMAKLQLKKDLTNRQVDTIEEFLNSLTGELPAHFREAPILNNSPQVY